MIVCPVMANEFKGETRDNCHTSFSQYISHNFSNTYKGIISALTKLMEPRQVKYCQEYYAGNFIS